MLDTSLIDEGWSHQLIKAFFDVAIKVEKAKIKGAKKTLRELPRGDFPQVYKPVRDKAKSRIRNAKARIKLLKEECDRKLKQKDK